MTEEPLATTEEVAAFLKVDRGTLQNWRSQHTGPPYIKTGSLVRYRWSAVRKWADSKTVSPAAEGAA
jgi:predicted DNA-binding transcriptional regulator AlpA